MRLFVRHVTRYAFSQPQRALVQMLRATPTSFIGQTVVDWRIDVGCDARLRHGRDGYGNRTTMLYVDGPFDEVAITLSGEVVTEDRAGVVAGAAETLPCAVYLRATPLTTADAAISEFAAGLHVEGGAPLDWLHRLSARLGDRLAFDTGTTGVETDAATAFAQGHGVCQDFAHIFLAAARSLGIPARYVSGHLFRRDGAYVQEASHAWVEAHVEGLGWIAFDPTNGICADDAYVRVAVGLDYGEASPSTGRRDGGGDERLDVDVRVALSQAQMQS